MKVIGLLIFLAYSLLIHVHASPGVCAVAKTPSFQNCLELRGHTSMCGYPVPRPCVHLSYYVPQYFIEVVDQAKESFFFALPGVATQLATSKEILPFGAQDDEGAYSFHARTINVPFTLMGFAGMPCGGFLWDNMCFTSMSEHLGDNWRTGLGDQYQPQWMAWALAPKACLIKGAVTSAMGGGRSTGYPAHGGLCSVDRSWMRKYPPSNQSVCNGWGIVFPRYGTVTSSDQVTASLMVASRMRSLGSEVFQSVPTFSDEKWQMIYPQASSCFREGQNVGILRLKRVNEMGRLWTGKIKNYLYVVWRRVRCTRDLPFYASARAWPSLLQGACGGLE